MKNRNCLRYISTCFGLLRKMKHISNGILGIYVGWCCSSQSTDMFSVCCECLCVCAKEFSSGFLGFFHCIALEWFGWVSFGSVLPFLLVSSFAPLHSHIYCAILLLSFPFPHTPWWCVLLILQSYMCCWRWFGRMCEKTF